MTSRTDFSQRISENTTNTVKAFLAVREHGKNPFASVKNLGDENISAEYHGRTIIELMQNAHDAHPNGSTDGHIAIVLDQTEGAHGVVYVANGGVPLTDANFRALVDLAQSNKLASEGIGHKGIGFRSVLQETDSPEVYSRSDADSETFDGYTFRFAREDDFDRLADSFEGKVTAAELRDNLSRFEITFPLVAVPARVASWARATDEERYSTVIRLPLLGEGRWEHVLEQVKDVVVGEAPPHLFLDRIESLRVTIVERDDETSSTTWFPSQLETGNERTLELTRRSERISPGLERVTLQDGREYLLATRTIPETQMQEAIQQTWETDRTPAGWRQWQGDARVTLAFMEEDAVESARFYTFLPMGRGSLSPLPAHLQAPFVSNMSRRDLDRSIPLNDFLISEAARLAADVLVAAASDPTGATAKEWGDVLIDLACWNEEYFDLHLEEALGEKGHSVEELEFIPTMVAGVRSSVTEARKWDPRGQFFCPENLPESQRAGLISLTIGKLRNRNLRQLYQQLGNRNQWSASPETLAEFAEFCAKALFEAQTPAEGWMGFYDELAKGLGKTQPFAGQHVVMGENKLLPLHAETSSLTLFFLPESEDSFPKAPKVLTKDLAFMPQPPWSPSETAGKGRPRDDSHPGKMWLEQWVRSFSTKEVMDHAAQVMAMGNASNDELHEIFRYIFAIWRSSGPNRPKIPSSVLVPTLGGWKKAGQAYFGNGWAADSEGGLGRDHRRADHHLARLAEEVAGVSDLNGVVHSILLDPTEWLGDEPIDEMLAFLEAAGVRHGLWPIELLHSDVVLDERQARFPKQLIDLQWHNPLELIPAPIRRQWLEYAGQRGPYETISRDGAYFLQSACILPGQSDWRRFGDEAKETYAFLIMHWLSAETEPAASVDSALVTKLKRDRGNYYLLVEWPSPIAAFLATEPWMLTDPPSNAAGTETAGVRHFATLGELWWSDRRVPGFVLVPKPSLRSIGGAVAAKRLAGSGLRSWASPGSAFDRLEFLAEVVVGQGDQEGLKIEYERAWRQHYGQQDYRLPRRLLFYEDGELTSLDPRRDLAGKNPIYYPVPGHPNTVLLHQLPGLKLALSDDSLAHDVGEHLGTWFFLPFTPIAQAEMDIRPEDIRQSGTLGEIFCDRFQVFVALCLHKLALESTLKDSLVQDNALNLRQLQMRVVEDFEISIDCNVVQVDSLRTSLSAVDPAEGNTIYVRMGARDYSLVDLAENMDEGLAYSLGRPALQSLLRAHISRLRTLARQQEHELTFRDLTDADLASIFALNEKDVVSVSEQLFGLEQLIGALIRVTATVDTEAAKGLRDRANEFSNEEEARTWLVDNLVLASEFDTDHVAGKLIDYARRDCPWETVTTGLVSLTTANLGLRALAFSSLSNESEQEKAFAQFLRENRGRYEEDLQRRIEQSTRGDDSAISQYADALRGLQSLEPNPKWGEEFWSVPQTEMELWVQNWLTQRVGPPGGSHVPTESHKHPSSVNAGSIGPLENRPTTSGSKRGSDGAPSKQPPQPSGSRRSPRRDLNRAVGRVGAESSRGFTPTIEDEVEWVDQLEPAALRRRGVAKEASDDPGRESVGPTDHGGARLAVDPQPVSDSGSGKGGKASRLADQIEPPPESYEVGRRGELIAGKIIDGAFGQPPARTWKSRYRNEVFNDGIGNDNLGYDFLVSENGTDIFIEVKATVGNQTRFRLTSTEVDRAKNLREGQQYRVLFIAHVDDEENLAHYWLPNPFESGPRVYEESNRIVREEYTFRFSPGEQAPL